MWRYFLASWLILRSSRRHRERYPTSAFHSPLARATAARCCVLFKLLGLRELLVLIGDCAGIRNEHLDMGGFAISSIHSVL